MAPTDTLSAITPQHQQRALFAELSSFFYMLIFACCVPFTAFWKWCYQLYRAIGYPHVVPVARQLPIATSVINNPPPHVTIYAPNLSISCNYFKSEVNIAKINVDDDDAATEAILMTPYSQNSDITDTTAPVSSFQINESDACVSRVLSTNVLRRIQSSVDPNASSFTSVD